MLSKDGWEKVGLTPAEAEVANLVCCGYTNSAIAAIRQTTTSSVKFHVTAINKKIRTKTRVEIILKSIELEHEAKHGPKTILPTGPAAS